MAEVQGTNKEPAEGKYAGASGVGAKGAAAGTAAAINALRKVTPGPGPDRFLAPEIEEAVKLVQSGVLIEEVEGSIGKLL